MTLAICIGTGLSEVVVHEGLEGLAERGSPGEAFLSHRGELLVQ